MKFLVDENIPKKLIKTLLKLGHDVVRAPLARPDSIIAQLAKDSGRVVITIDKDFVALRLYSNIVFDMVFIQIHPPYKEDVEKAFLNLLNSCPSEDIKGLIVLDRFGHGRIPVPL